MAVASLDYRLFSVSIVLQSVSVAVQYFLSRRNSFLFLFFVFFSWPISCFLFLVSRFLFLACVFVCCLYAFCCFFFNRNQTTNSRLASTLVQAPGA